MLEAVTSHCPNCGGANSSHIDQYKINVEYDRRFFGDGEILRCKGCDLCYLSPMPSGDSLNKFYGSVYREVGRPHYADPKNPPQPMDRHLSYVSTLTTNIQMNSVATILEVGPGSGEIGLLLLAIFPSLKIYCIEPDEHSQKILKDRGYIPISSSNEIPGSVDLVMSLHSLEHFSNVDTFFSLFNEKLKTGGFLFLEVPNCPFENGFENRPYDSPHLLFFTKETLTDMAVRRNFDPIEVHTSGHRFVDEFKLALDEQATYQGWLPGVAHPISSRALLRKILPIKIRLLIQQIRSLRSMQVHEVRVFHHLHNDPNSWLVRGIFKKL